MSRFRLDGKVALVTGGGSGIGAAICRAMVEQGARVTVAEIDQAHGAGVAGELGESAHFAQTDVTDMGSVQRAVAETVDSFGRLDVMVNCAGIVFVGTVQETASDDFDRLMAVNARGVFHGCRAAVDQMLDQQPKGGVIINIASTAGLVGVPRRFAYCATKGAVLAMTRELAIDYVREGIRCNAICPGSVFTPLIESWVDQLYSDTKEQTIAELHARQPIGRMGRPAEIADLAVYLASDAAGFMTGSAVTIDGGWTAA